MRSLIAEGPVGSSLFQSADACSTLDMLARCWEFPHIESKEKESRALARNAELALDHIQRYVSPPGRLLDFGCGGGFFLSVAAQRGWVPYGLEPLAGHAAYARAKFGIQVVNDTLREDTFPESFFDVITAFQVFEHLPDPVVELTKLKQILKPRGLLLIEVPNIETWSVRLLSKHHRHFVQDHLNFFSSSTLRTLVVNSGFEPLLIYYPVRYMTVRHLLGDWGSRMGGSMVGGFLNRLSSKIRLEKRIISLNLGDIVAIVARKI